MKIYITDTSALMKRQLFARAYAAVPQERRRRIDRFRFPKDRCRSLGAGVLLNRALAEAGVDETEFVYGPDLDCHGVRAGSAKRLAMTYNGRSAPCHCEEPSRLAGRRGNPVPCFRCSE